jgi:hypothetical protein
MDLILLDCFNCLTNDDKPKQCSRFTPILDEENNLFKVSGNNLFKVSGKQHVSFEVILVYNAMESFQQKVPPILLGAFEDIFD